MQVVGACILAVMILVAAIFVSLWFAWSVLVGGIISMCSFWIANKGVLKLVETVTSLGSPEDQKTKSSAGTTRVSAEILATNCNYRYCPGSSY